MNAIAQTHDVFAPREVLAALMRQVAAKMQACGAHPARTVVLLPFFHLLPLAREAWAAARPDGFAPRFETTQNWSAPLAAAPQTQDYTGDVGRDLLTARALLEQAGAAGRAELLASHLLEAAAQLAPQAAGVLPSERRAWAARVRQAIAAGMAPPLGLESLVASVAIEWVAASSYRSDVLLAKEGPLAQVDLLVVVQALRADALTEAIAQVAGAERVATFPLPLVDDGGQRGAIAMHEADDPADEAERAAACVIRHVEAGRVPVALPAIDRVLARRIRAMLEQRQAGIRDETGWKLSTTRAGAHVMLALRACGWQASSDAVVDWLKNAPALPSFSVLALERRIRRAGLREWAMVGEADAGETLAPRVARVNAWRDSLRAARTLPAWLASLRALLVETGQWPALERDTAGRDVIAALRLAEHDEAGVAQWAQATRRLDLSAFTSWVNDSLEAASFKAPAQREDQVVILPFQQMLGRPFAALVLAGCDEVRLPAAPEPDGPWTEAQRRLLGLPTRESLEAERRTTWQHALQVPHVDILWRRTDDNGEPVLPSTLVQALDDHVLRPHDVPRADDDARIERAVAIQPARKPTPTGASLPLAALSASAYEDLRRCPYRFFALRQLGLQEPDEIDQSLDKRDFGNWLHQVLRLFHEAMAANPQPPGDARRRLLEECAERATQAARLDEGEFMPFSAAWPQARDGYLQWLASHEAQECAVFQSAESEHELQLGPVKLMGRIDRVDHVRGGHAMVMDYKTESETKTKQRVATPMEDTQLAFYAALLADDELRAAYVNIGERGETRTIEQRDVVRARDRLVEGILHDMGRIGEGEPLGALGAGMVCDYCAARGLCRKDDWS